MAPENYNIRLMDPDIETLQVIVKRTGIIKSEALRALIPSPAVMEAKLIFDARSVRLTEGRESLFDNVVADSLLREMQADEEHPIMFEALLFTPECPSPEDISELYLRYVDASGPAEKYKFMECPDEEGNTKFLIVPTPKGLAAEKEAAENE